MALSTKKRRILCIWLPNWPIQRTKQDEPALKCALVLETDARVSACCSRARRAGIRPEMPIEEAKTMVSRLAIRQSDQELDRKKLEALAEACEQFSPMVGLENDNLLLDITGLEHLFGSEQQLTTKVRQYFESRGYAVCLAVADTIGLAWALAHYAEAQIPQLPVEALRLPDETLALLRELGIERIEHLLALPRNSLPSRFGPQLSRRLDQLMGHSEEMITPCRPKLPFEVSLSLEHPISDRYLVSQILQKLIGELSNRLKAQDKGAFMILCKFTCSGEVIALPTNLFQPSANPQRIMELIELGLERLNLPDEVSAVAASAPQTSRLVHAQQKLFSKEKNVDPHQLALLVNRLSVRLGVNRVLFPQYRTSAAPERIRHYVPATERPKKSKTPKNRLRPLLLYQQPIAIAAVSVSPDGPPQVVWLSNGKQHITSSIGPERIETGWWRGKTVRRDYYRITTESGSTWWLFRCLRENRWFLHGEFT